MKRNDNIAFINNMRNISRIVLICAITFKMVGAISSARPKRVSTVSSAITDAIINPLRIPSSTKTRDSTESVGFPTKVRVRKMEERDINDVASLLAKTVVGEKLSFNEMVRFLKAKTEFETQIRSRHICIDAGYKTLRRAREQHESISREMMSKVLWSDDIFRDKVENAVKKSNERWHGWHNWNYAISPPVNMLQHLMIVVEGEDSGNVLGFCEVGMLSRNFSDEDHGDGDNNPLQIQMLSPTIMNLTVDPQFRRKGLACKLMTSARRFTRRYFDLPINEALGLYVKTENEAARRLYEKLGFLDVVDSSPNSDDVECILDDGYFADDDLCYMECQLYDNCMEIEEEAVAML